MKRFWLGLALLSASWLPGLGYYHPPEWWLYGALIWLAVMLFSGLPAPQPPGRLTALLSIALMLPATFFAPWPFRMGPILICFGLAFSLFIFHQVRWMRRIAYAPLTVGIILLFQSLVILVYQSITARSHDLPNVLGQIVYGVARLFGVDAAYDGANVYLPTMRRTHGVGATWELLLDIPSLCFITGGLIVLFMRAWDEDSLAARLKRFARPALCLLLAAALWLPLRAGLLMALLVDRAILTDYDAPLLLMDQFWSSCVHLVMLVPFAFIAMKLISVPAVLEANPGSPSPQAERGLGGEVYSARNTLLGMALSFAGVAALTLAIFWDPVGERKAGRVVIEEFHYPSDRPDKEWEPTEKPFDTEWYGYLSGYNYYCIYQFLAHHYEMSRQTTPLTDDALRNVDVLVLKVPTLNYDPQEIDAIVRYVDGGGSLLLIGEHTDVFGTGVSMNGVAQRFGFRFNYDCLFGIDTFFDETYRPSFIPHPVVQNIDQMDFAISCSIDTGSSNGRAVILSKGLKRGDADYHATNYYPQAEDYAAMRYGSFVQVWAVRHGAGRVLAFTDSTIFSNFAAFEPGKRELLLGMVEWLNHRGGASNPRVWLLPLGILLLAFCIALAWRQRRECILFIAAGALGWVCAGSRLNAAQQRAMPLPSPVRPYINIAIDRTTCDSPLSKSGFISGDPVGFGIFERWILRLGYFTQRASGDDVFKSNLAVFLYPRVPVKKTAPDFEQKLVEYVENGGKILVVDSPTNTRTTTTLIDGEQTTVIVPSQTNQLLKPFGLSIKNENLGAGNVTNIQGWPEVPVDAAADVTGGQALFHFNGKPVGTTIQFGKGTVTLIGFGSRFTDTNMGVTGDVEPNPALRKVFDIEYGLLRRLMGESK